MDETAIARMRAQRAITSHRNSIIWQNLTQTTLELPRLPCEARIRLLTLTKHQQHIAERAECTSLFYTARLNQKGTSILTNVKHEKSKTSPYAKPTKKTQLSTAPQGPFSETHQKQHTKHRLTLMKRCTGSPESRQNRDMIKNRKKAFFFLDKKTVCGNYADNIQRAKKCRKE